ncbi:trypsin-like peptidase domain-containing protein [Candidatus Bipolaricaulota bacterium]|nr:trypsin-like peptidase domain-containing protein [Candidatus Bipolaricaulota bacterium]
MRINRLRSARCTVLLLLLAAAISYGAAGTPPPVQAAADAGYVLWLDIFGLCSQSGDPASFGCTATLLENGQILTVAHLFWCDDDASFHSDWLSEFDLYVEGRTEQLSPAVEPNPRIDEMLDLAWIDLDRSMSEGVDVASGSEDLLTPARMRVWIVGYRRGTLEVVPGRVIESPYDDRSRLWISVKTPITPGFSGSPVLAENGQLIGVITAKLLDQPVVIATQVDAELALDARE